MRTWKPVLSRKDGVTVLEVLLAAGLLSIVLIVAYALLNSGSRQQNFVSQHAELSQRTRLAVRQITKDIRSARSIIGLRRSNSGSLEELSLELPEVGDDSSFERVEYRYDTGSKELLRNDDSFLSKGVRDFQLFAFDDLGKLLSDAEIQEKIAFFRLRFELGEEDDPPAKQRKLDLTVTPRVLSSQSKAERTVLDRSLERFGAQVGNSPTGSPTNTP